MTLSLKKIKSKIASQNGDREEPVKTQSMNEGEEGGSPLSSSGFRWSCRRHRQNGLGDV